MIAVRDIVVNEELTYDYGVRTEGWMKVKSGGSRRKSSGEGGQGVMRSERNGSDGQGTRRESVGGGGPKIMRRESSCNGIMRTERSREGGQSRDGT